MLEQELTFLTHTAGKDIVDDLDSNQLKELISQVNEPSELDASDEVEYKNSTSKWRSK